LKCVTNVDVTASYEALLRHRVTAVNSPHSLHYERQCVDVSAAKHDVAEDGFRFCA
jgi:hypothetical protein